MVEKIGRPFRTGGITGVYETKERAKEKREKLFRMVYGNCFNYGIRDPYG